jgi:hypothetical protein
MKKERLYVIGVVVLGMLPVVLVLILLFIV